MRCPISIPARISKEIQSFASGKDPEYAWKRARTSTALSDEQRPVLEQRGVLSAAEIHELADKVRCEMGDGEDSPAACHSDYVDDAEARRLQAERRADSS